jgi:hypothetical protein
VARLAAHSAPSQVEGVSRAWWISRSDSLGTDLGICWKVSEHPPSGNARCRRIIAIALRKADFRTSFQRPVPTFESVVTP